MARWRTTPLRSTRPPRLSATISSIIRSPSMVTTPARSSPSISIATATSTSSRLRRRLAPSTRYENQGAAGYQRHTIGVSLPASSMVAADMDGDGDLDLVVSASGLYWLENDGAQQFTSRSSFDVSTTTQHLYAADVDDDGDMDLLTSNHRYLNNGQQNFFQVRHPSSTLNGGSVFPADLDRDGDLDLVAPIPAPALSW